MHIISPINVNVLINIHVIDVSFLMHFLDSSVKFIWMKWEVYVHLYKIELYMYVHIYSILKPWSHLSYRGFTPDKSNLSGRCHTSNTSSASILSIHYGTSIHVLTKGFLYTDSHWLASSKYSSTSCVLYSCNTNTRLLITLVKYVVLE